MADKKPLSPDEQLQLIALLKKLDETDALLVATSLWMDYQFTIERLKAMRDAVLIQSIKEGRLTVKIVD